MRSFLWIVIMSNGHVEWFDVGDRTKEKSSEKSKQPIKDAWWTIENN